MNAQDIIKALGEDVMADAVGVTVFSVRAARTANLFPASWYAAVTDLGDANGVEVPMDVFRWKSAITRRDSTPPLSPRESDVKGG